MTRVKILTVTIHDCEVQTFRSGGKGGQNQNKRDTGVRVIHPPSGGVGESREQRSQLQNKRTAFRKMIDTPKFQLWLKLSLGKDMHLESEINRWLKANNCKVEVLHNGQWIDVS